MSIMNAITVIMNATPNRMQAIFSSIMVLVY